MSTLPLQNMKEMSVVERMVLVEVLRNQHASSILKEWLVAVDDRDDPMRAAIIASVLVEALRKPKGAKANAELIADFLAKNSTSLDRMLPFVALLGTAATKESLSTLLELAATDTSPEIKKAAVAQIERVGDFRWDARFHEELSPLLEKAWSAQPSELSVNQAIGISLGKIGAPSAVELLFLSAQSGGADIQDQDDARAQTATTALRYVRNPVAVSVLESHLLESPAGAFDNKLAGQSLALMGDPTATQALLRWAQVAGDEAAPLLKDWFSLVRDTESLKILEKASSRNIPFNSKQNAEALRTALVEWHAARGGN